MANGQRPCAFADPRVQALLSCLAVFRLLPQGFANGDLREHLAPLLGLGPDSLTQGRMSYDLRRLRLHGLIERIDGTHRYRVTDFGLRAAVFFTRPTPGSYDPAWPSSPHPIRPCPLLFGAPLRSSRPRWTTSPSPPLRAVTADVAAASHLRPEQGVRSCD